MNDWRLPEILKLLGLGAEIALRHYRSPRTELKSDRSLVTEADREIEALYAQAFDRPQEGSYLIGEETIGSRSEEYIRQAFRQLAWIVDPIDGTAPYAHHIPTWGISIGMMRRGVLEEGAVYLPITGELFLSEGERLLYAEGQSPALLADGPKLQPLPVRLRDFDDGGLIALTQNMARRGSFNLVNPVQALCTIVVPLTYLCLGRYLAVIGSIKLWDIAGALPILLKAGLKARLLMGRPLGLEVEAQTYDLDSESKKRWWLREVMVACGSEETMARVIQGIEKTE